MPKLQSRGPRRSSRLDLPRDLVLERLSRFNLLDSWVGKIPWRRKLAIHSSTLAWKIPWMEEPDRLQSMGSQRVEHDWATSLHIPYLNLTFCQVLGLKIGNAEFCSWTTAISVQADHYRQRGDLQGWLLQTRKPRLMEMKMCPGQAGQWAKDPSLLWLFSCATICSIQSLFLGVLMTPPTNGLSVGCQWDLRFGHTHSSVSQLLTDLMKRMIISSFGDLIIFQEVKSDYVDFILKLKSLWLLTRSQPCTVGSHPSEECPLPLGVRRWGEWPLHAQRVIFWVLIALHCQQRVKTKNRIYFSMAEGKSSVLSVFNFNIDTASCFCRTQSPRKHVIFPGSSLYGAGIN